MKVLHVAPSVSASYGGPTESLFGFALAAVREGIAATIAAPVVDDAERRSVETRMAGVTMRFFPTFGSGSTIWSPRLWQWLRRSASAFDVVHVHGLFNPVSSLAARIALASTPTIIRPFGTLSRYTFSHRRALLKRAYFRGVESPNIARATLHFTSESERAEAARLGVVGNRPSFIVPPPLRMVPPTTGSSGGAEMSVAAQALFLGRLHRVKNVEALLAAWASVIRRVPDARLVIAGVGSDAYERELRTAADASGIAASVSFAGFADAARKEELFRTSQVLVLPSRHENFGVAALEASARGLPVIVTPEVALSSFIAGNGLGIVVESKAAALADAIVRSLTDRVLQDRCRVLGTSLVAREFSEEHVGRQLRTMYEASIGTKPQAAGARAG
jgi:glycosyltransferase involved in cell wall biosynthesis